MGNKQRQTDFDMIIVGSGIAGPSLACALAKYGLRILILEKRSNVGTIHRGDSLVPKNTELLKKWGVLSDIIEAGAVAIEELEFHHEDKKLFNMRIAKNSTSPYLVLPHAEIEILLKNHAARAEGVTVIQSAVVTELIREKDNGRIIGVRYKDDNGEQEVRAAITVAADGRQSKMRNMLNLKPTTYYYKNSYMIFEAECPENYEHKTMRIQLHEEGGVFLVPTPDRVGVAIMIPSNKAGYWMKAKDKELTDILEKRAPVLKGMKLFRERAHAFPLIRTHVSNYVTPGAVIIGDAAHTTNPAAGQGMALALSDADTLADYIGPVLAAAEDPTNALQKYEANQWKRNQKMVRLAHLLALIFTRNGKVNHKLDMACMKVVSSPIGDRFVKPFIENLMG